jgi:hypothetical protein
MKSAQKKGITNAKYNEIGKFAMVTQQILAIYFTLHRFYYNEILNPYK